MDCLFIVIVILLFDSLFYMWRARMKRQTERPFFRWLRIIALAVISPIIAYQAFQGWHDGQRLGISPQHLWMNLVAIGAACALCVVIYLRMIIHIIRWQRSGRPA